MIKVRGELLPLLSCLPTARGGALQLLLHRHLHSPRFPSLLLPRHLPLTLHPKHIPLALPSSVSFSSSFKLSYIPGKESNPIQTWALKVFSLGFGGNAVVPSRTFYRDSERLQDARREQEAEGCDSVNVAGRTSERSETSTDSATRVRKTKSISTTRLDRARVGTRLKKASVDDGRPETETALEKDVRNGFPVSKKGRVTTSEIIRKTRLDNLVEAESEFTIERSDGALDTDVKKRLRQSGAVRSVSDKGEDGFERAKEIQIEKSKIEYQTARGILKKRQQERSGDGGDKQAENEQLTRGDGLRSVSDLDGHVFERAKEIQPENPKFGYQTAKVKEIQSEILKSDHQTAREVFEKQPKNFPSYGRHELSTSASLRGNGGYRRARETQFAQHKESREGWKRRAFDSGSGTGTGTGTGKHGRADANENDLERGIYQSKMYSRFPEREHTKSLLLHRAHGKPVYNDMGRREVGFASQKSVGNGPSQKDFSVQAVPGEKNWQYKIREKRAKAEAREAREVEVDYEQLGDDWIRKRICWLCKEIPVLKAAGTVKILNGQKKWIKDEHIKQIIEHMLNMNELNRAHRVLKWMQQQHWYKFDYELHTKVANVLGQNAKVTRTQDVFDEIIRNGMVPDASTFTVLIKAYIQDGDPGSIDEAWKLYNQMIQLGRNISSSLLEALFKGLACSTGRWLQQAEALFESMKNSGHHINDGMYSCLIEIYGKRGDHRRVDALIQEMKEEHLEIGLKVMNAVLAACAKDGNTEKAENTLKGMTEMGMKLDWRSYVYLIQTYGTAGLHMKSLEIFKKMKEENISLNTSAYHAIINVMANALESEHVMQLLTDVENSGHKPLQPCYNSAMNMYLRLMMYEEVESIFNRAKAANARPSHAAYNMLIKAYVQSAQLEKAESIFQQMKKKGAIGPNTHTYNLILEGYGVACLREKVKEIFLEMLGKGLQVDPHVSLHIKSMVGVKRLALLEKEKLTLGIEQREIIAGVLLGGAHMESPDKNRTYELHLEFNCEKRAASVLKDHLFLLFDPWWKPNRQNQGEAQESLTEGTVKKVTRLETINHGSLRFYAHQYRPKGEPVVPRLIHRWLKPRTLAYWYMYGGRKCQRTGGIVLNASKYSGKQIQLVVKALKARTIDCRRRKRRNGSVIRFEGKSAMWLWKLMEPYILEELREDLRPEEVAVNFGLTDDQDLASDEEGSSDEEEGWEDLGGSDHVQEVVCS